MYDIHRRAFEIQPKKNEPNPYPSFEGDPEMNIAQQIHQQRTYFMRGDTLDYTFRLRALTRLSIAIREMADEIIEALRVDLNKPETEAYLTEISTVQKELDYTINSLSQWMKKTRVKTPLALFPAQCYSLPEPYGLVLIMSPWNYPFMLAITPLIGAIAAGNCALVKPSAYAPTVAKVIEKLIRTCFDPDYCTTVLGSRAENMDLLAQKFDYIFFTGSVAVGQAVMTAAAKHLTPVTLELGGKSPTIVDQTADLDLAAKRLVFGKYMNAGQTCVAPDYVLVHEDKKNELIERLRVHIDRAYPKDKNGFVQDYPQIINDKHFHRLRRLMEGESIAVGGEVYPDQRTIEPTVLQDVSLDAAIMQEEIFGPILPIISYQQLDQALAEIQKRPKPLALYLFSSDRALWQRIEKTLSFGGGCINDCLLHVSSPYLPFGGVGASGMGRYHGKASFDTFSHHKSIVNKGSKIDFEMRYRPYSEKVSWLLRKL